VKTFKIHCSKVKNCTIKRLKKYLNSCKYFSISLDETTDVTSDAQLAIIARHSDGLTMREELIKLESVPISTSRQMGHQLWWEKMWDS
jgi:hypothetical protein